MCEETSRNTLPSMLMDRWRQCRRTIKKRLTRVFEGMAHMREKRAKRISSLTKVGVYGGVYGS